MNLSATCTGEKIPPLKAMCTYFQHITLQYYQRILMTNGSMSSNDTLQDELKRGLDNAPAKQGWFQVAIPIISVLGVIGNLLNLTVLTQRRLLSSMDILEKSATHGLVALAISDMLFCATLFPHCFIDEVDMVDESHLYRIYYKIYGISLVNLFLMTSTWLIVTMSVSRYLVVVYPLHARSRLTTFRTLVAIVLVFVISTVMTLPSFLHAKVGQCCATNPSVQYELKRTFNEDITEWLLWYVRWIWPLLAGFIPFGILAFCNTRLIWELKKATNTRQRTARGQIVRNSSQKVTLTLVIIVLMLLFLVAPSEILRYINPYEFWGVDGFTVASVTNVLQAINFAFNFILYCAVSASFRQTFKSMFCSFSKRHVEKAEMQRMLQGHMNNTEKSIIMDTEIE